MADLDFPLPAPISDPKKHHARGQNRSGARPSGACAGGGHSLELLKAKMLFLEGKYVQDRRIWEAEFWRRLVVEGRKLVLFFFCFGPIWEHVGS